MKKFLSVFLGLMLFGCVSKPYVATIVCNDFFSNIDNGVICKNSRTTVEINDTKHRMILDGYYGQTGEVFTVYEHLLKWSPTP